MPLVQSWCNACNEYTHAVLHYDGLTRITDVIDHTNWLRLFCESHFAYTRYTLVRCTKLRRTHKLHRHLKCAISAPQPISLLNNDEVLKEIHLFNKMTRYINLIDIFEGRKARRDSLSPDSASYLRRRDSKSHLSPDRNVDKRDISPIRQRKGRLRRQSTSMAGRLPRYLHSIDFLNVYITV